MEFEIDKREYRAEKLSAIVQFHLSRKLAPLLLDLAPMFARARNLTKELSTSSNLLEFVELAGPFAAALRDMDDDAAADIWKVTLGSVQVKTHAGAWIALWIAGANKASEIELDDLGALLPIMLRIIQFNLGPFISGFLMSREEPQPEQSTGGVSPIKRTG